MRSWTRRIPGQRVWVIGASSGIGAELAKELDRLGARVAITARRRDRLEQIAGESMEIVPADAADPKAIVAAAKTASEALGGLDTVVWCAGYWRQTDPGNWDTKEFARHVEVNLLGLNAVLGAVLPGMVERGRGHLVGVTSVSGYRGFPGAEAYGSTKAAQIALLESLRASLRRRGVRVTTVAPGFVRTEMTAVNQFPMPFIIDADKAGRIIARGLRRGRAEIVFPLRMAIAMKLARLLPVRWWAAMMGPRKPRPKKP
ncbi:MAG: SDR family NAD(P)-dependent oxidoreductase [Demequinaceae bacterium]|nr:SDR family NAD(P)-dependent oxidoreductase [Demequinaceae bacterium]